MDPVMEIVAYVLIGLALLGGPPAILVLVAFYVGEQADHRDLQAYFLEVEEKAINSREKV